jgi:hypothetical protein
VARLADMCPGGLFGWPVPLYPDTRSAYNLLYGLYHRIMGLVPLELPHAQCPGVVPESRLGDKVLPEFGEYQKGVKTPVPPDSTFQHSFK